jgi:hypothetical protein
MFAKYLFKFLLFINFVIILIGGLLGAFDSVALSFNPFVNEWGFILLTTLLATALVQTDKKFNLHVSHGLFAIFTVYFLVVMILTSSFTFLIFAIISFITNLLITLGLTIKSVFAFFGYEILPLSDNKKVSSTKHE